MKFALDFSDYYTLDIIIFHSLNSTKNSSLEAEDEKLRKEFDYAKRHNPNISVKTILAKEENVLNKINDIIEAEAVDYIVMGAKGKSGSEPTVFGSYISDILITANCPVFAIPLISHNKGISKILCLTEMEEPELKAIEQCLKLSRIHESEIVFYFASEHELSQTKRKLLKLKESIKKITSYPRIEFVTERSENILSSIENYICNSQPDLVVTLGKERSLWDRLFSKKITKNLCLHTTVPILSFPQRF
ncbi:universal stress protein [Sporocytophaga myxococcoides]|uniref:Universal stress protein n=2 Tax=Sporocytophaga myxococcoides TaxID=153721 RepID=A0A098LH37_9BACT|nr:universal stress protein [Sporocytophaga myxococcoides]